ncbi:MAG: SdpI family protein [Clostridia bacterium]|nr:SdpI family protein [Clostridia bacterium]
MWFWWFMLICDLLIPVIMFIAGIIMWKHCPKNINAFFGYRTTRSMKNMDTWRFAHDYCGRLWWKIGLIMLVPSALIHIPFYHSDENTLGLVGGILMTIQCIVLIVSIFPTESALKNTFNDDGTRI